MFPKKYNFGNRCEIMFILLFILWIIFAGAVSVTTVVEGLAVAALVTLFCCKFMGYHLMSPLWFFKKCGHIFIYVIKLLKEIVLANIAVLKILYSGKEPKARVVHFKSDLEDEGLQTLAANSITLTPGTITVDLHDGEYLVHGLDKSLTEDIKNCCFFNDVKKLKKAK